MPSKKAVARKAPVSPVKLRSACNQCHAAKLRCSGEHEGCMRCQSTGQTCTYSESRVGKVPGIRTKRRKQADAARVIDTQMPLQASYEFLESDYFGNPLSFGLPHDMRREEASHSGAYDGFEQDILHLDPALTIPSAGLDTELDLDISRFNLGSPVATASQFETASLYDSTSPGSSLTPLSASALPILEFPDEILAQHGFDPSTIALDSAGHAEMPDSDGMTHLNTRKSIHACTRLVESLEAELSNPTVAAALDRVLSISRTGTAEIVRLLSLEDVADSVSGLQLLGIALSQIVSLFENHIHTMTSSSLLAVSTSQDMHLHSPAESEFPGHVSGRTIRPSTLLRFGNYSIDDEEQAVLRAHIARKELRRIGHVLEHIRLAQAETAGNGSITITSPAQWESETSARVEVLLTALSKMT